MDLVDFDQRKFCVIVCANKNSRHPKELYTLRHYVINFYEKNHPEDLDLYGPDWKGLHIYKGMITGSIRNKIETLRNYKFSYCYENMRDEPGYISEKIFNCFEAGCIPIYWGASNITHFIPSNCFISRTDFKTDED